MANNIRVNDLINDKKLVEFLRKEDFWVFEKSENEFHKMMYDQELPVYLCARKGGYKDYGLPVPTTLWMDMFLESSGEQSRVLFALLHNIIYERSLPKEYRNTLENLFVQPYQGYGLYA